MMISIYLSIMTRLILRGKCNVNIHHGTIIIKNDPYEDYISNTSHHITSHRYFSLRRPHREDIVVYVRLSETFCW